jgi:Uma2 family endonuclease
MAPRKHFITPEEYLKLERASEEKHEYVAGQILAMSSASKNHNLIVGSTFAALYNPLRQRPCQLFPK